jgi:predicted DNA binding CopG/RHH family protein
MVTGNCYQSNKKSYHQIRYQSDKLCKENNLSVIDEFYESYKKKYKTNGKSWYENEQAKRGTSWKSRLQFDIDRMIKQSKDWEEFLKKIAELGYEIKHGKHIAFKPKDKPRFTRAKTIGEDYTEERLKERLAKRASIKNPTIKKRIGNVIDLNTNTKVKESNGYEYWATKHNLNTMAESIIFLREQGIKSVNQLDEYIQKAADERQNLQDKIKDIDKEIQELSATMEQVHTVKKYRTTKNIRQVRLTRHFLKSIKLRLPYTKMPFQSLKNPIPSSQIQRIFYLNLMMFLIFVKRRIMVLIYILVVIVIFLLMFRLLRLSII